MNEQTLKVYFLTEPLQAREAKEAPLEQPLLPRYKSKYANFTIFKLIIVSQSEGCIIDVTNRREESPSEPISPTDASLKPSQKVVA